MGMPISLDIPGCNDAEIFASVFKELQIVDEQFSPYKPDSELSKFNRGELSQEEVSIGMQTVMKACLEWESKTSGYFSARYDGGFEPSGYVKGWAIHEAGNSLKKLGYETFCLGAGGDILAASRGEKVWKLGIQHPEHKSQILGSIPAQNIGVATSGTYERGNHIINPKTGKPAITFVSLTVIGPDIIIADVLATAAFAMGKKGLEFVDSWPGYEILAVDKERTVYMSTGIRPAQP
jgi:thiamine biosynthesis lipoprotein